MEMATTTGLESDVDNRTNLRNVNSRPREIAFLTMAVWLALKSRCFCRDTEALFPIHEPPTTGLRAHKYTVSRLLQTLTQV